MSKKIKIKIDGDNYSCSPDKSVLEVARANGFDIPSLCYHPDFPAKGNCRVCVVEVKFPGSSKFKMVTSCSTQVQEGMEVKTNTKKALDSRKLNLELIFAEHIEECNKCVWKVSCPLLALSEKYDLKITRFHDRKKKREIYKFGNAVEIDGTQCIDCRNCIDACGVLQNINYLKVEGKGIHQEVRPVRSWDTDCIYCGQCALHCPVSAAQEQLQLEEVEKKIKKREKIMVAQFAPSIRVSVGEDFGLPHGKIMTGQVVSALRMLGFDYVFDVNFGADLTTMVEAKELLERVKNKETMPMMTSCCPAWVKYIEFYHPELIPNLTTSRSPHIHLGGVIKNYWAKQMNIKPKDIQVVSIMPCTAKKFEASRKEMKIKGMFPVDHVLTTREFSWMIKRKKIDFANIKSMPADMPLGEHTGAAAIYAGSGGVMESALRTAHHLACKGKKKGVCRPRIDFKEVRGLEGIKEADVKVAGKNMRVAIVNGIGNIEPIIENLDCYDYVEVMSCPGGCIGGGGQPIPTTNEIREKRIKALYKIDKSKKVRKAHENKGVKEVMDWIEAGGKNLEHQILHTSYTNRRKK